MLNKFLSNLKNGVKFFKIGAKHGAKLQRLNLEFAEEILSDENIDVVVDVIERIVTDPAVVSLVTRLSTKLDDVVERAQAAQVQLLAAVEAETAIQLAEHRAAVEAALKAEAETAPESDDVSTEPAAMPDESAGRTLGGDDN